MTIFTIDSESLLTALRPKSQRLVSAEAVRPFQPKSNALQKLFMPLLRLR
jgi:hypothetical protein